MFDSPTWEQVLASFEQNVDRAEGLLNPEPAAAMAAISLSYDPAQLAMPAIPELLLPRAHAVHARQQRLIEALQSSMRSLRQQEQLAGAAAAHRDAQRGSVYVDRRA